jgi:hypothetical protein
MQYCYITCSIAQTCCLLVTNMFGYVCFFLFPVRISSPVAADDTVLHCLRCIQNTLLVPPHMPLIRSTPLHSNFANRMNCSEGASAGPLQRAQYKRKPWKGHYIDRWNRRTESTGRFRGNDGCTSRTCTGFTAHHLMGILV